MGVRGVAGPATQGEAFTFIGPAAVTLTLSGVTESDLARSTSNTSLSRKTIGRDGSMEREPPVSSAVAHAARRTAYARMRIANHPRADIMLPWHNSTRIAMFHNPWRLFR